MTEQSHQPENAPTGTPAPGAAPSPVPGPKPTPPGPPSGDGPTGDPQVDAALADLEGAAPDDLDAQIETAQRVHRTLQSRLSDLGGQ